MNLKLLKIMASSLEIKRKDQHLHWDSHHVKEIFMASLPAKYTIDGSSQIAIVCGKTISDVKFRSILGSTTCFVEHFDFDSYWALEKGVRENLILDLIEKTLCELARENEVETSIIEETAEKVRKINFQMSIEISKLNLYQKERNLHFKIFRNLSKELGETWSVKIIDGKGKLLDEKVIGETPDYLDLRGALKKTTLEDGVLVFRDRFGMVFRTVK
jgi:hypothetical protein